MSRPAALPLSIAVLALLFGAHIALAPLGAQAAPVSRVAPGTQAAQAAQAAPGAPAAPGARAASAAPAAQGAEQPVLLERVGDVAVAQLYADGFTRLTPDERKLCWHLSQAAIAGRDIYWSQRSSAGPLIRFLMEGILTHADGIDAATLAEVRRYTTLLWVNCGQYNNITARKNVLTCTPEALVAAAQQAERNGAFRGGDAGGFVQGLQQDMFDPAYKPMVTAKNPEGGLDIVQGSANSFYGPGVTLAAVDAFAEKYPLNSTVELGGDGELVERVWRAGSPDDGIPPGEYAAELEAIIGHLNDAMPYAPAATKAALEKLIRFYRTGAVADREAYDIAWVADDGNVVDTVNGFIEVYVDARGKKGGWEGIVSYEDPQKAALIKGLADSAQWFEDHMPYAKEFRKPEVKGVSARSIDVVCETGDSGPVTPIGINLPNDDRIRDNYGSKSVSLANVIAANTALSSSGVLDEFCWDADEIARAKAWGPITGDMLTNMHEVIGHASGRQDAEHAGDPATWIKENFSALEEARADLVALYFMADPKLKELGLLTDPDTAARAAYENYTRNGLMLQLRRIPSGLQIEEDHMRNRQMVAHWIFAHSDAIEPHTRDGKQYYSVRDVQAWREAAGRLLAEVQRIKSTGDRSAAAALFDENGDTFDPALRDQVVARYAKLDVPSYTGFVQPRLSPIWGADGALADVSISYPLSLETQMLEWSGRALPPVTLPEDPAALYHTVLNRLLDAPDLTLHFEAVATGGLVAHEQGTLRLNALNRVDLSVDASTDGAEREASLTSNGATYHVKTFDKDRNGAVPARLNAGLIHGLMTRGILHNVHTLRTSFSVQLVDGTPDGLALRHFTALPDGEVRGQPVRRIQFTAHDGDTQVAEVTLDISKATGLPVHREQTVHFTQGDMRDVEDYLLLSPAPR